MGWVRVIVRVGVAWLMSLVVAAIGMELARRVVLATERDATASVPDGRPPAVSLARQRAFKAADF